MIASGPMGNSRSQGMSGDARAPGSGSSPDAHLHADAASSASSAHRQLPHDAGDASTPAAGDGKPIAEALKSAFSHVLEGADHMHTLLQVRADRTRLSLRRWMTIAIVAVLAATALVPLILGGVVLFVVGLAQAFSHWMGERAYLGSLAGGTLILGLIALITWITLARLWRSELADMAAKYERIQREHEARFGQAAAGPRTTPAGTAAEKPAEKKE